MSAVFSDDFKAFMRDIALTAWNGIKTAAVWVWERYARELVCFGIGLLVGLMDIATANNTVAIVMANPIASEIAKDYGISPRKTASILDTFSCIFQGILPYGAQMLVALSVVGTMGLELSAFDVIANLFYPMMLLVSSLVFMFFIPERKKEK